MTTTQGFRRSGSSSKVLVSIQFAVVYLILVTQSTIADTPTAHGQMVFDFAKQLKSPGIYQPRPPQVQLDVDHYPVAPSNLILEQVHVYARHGERAPVGVRLSNAPASIPEHWMMCNTARHFQSAVTDLVGEDASSYTRRMVERSDGSASDGECLLGELTDLGRQSTYDLGTSLRKLYIDKLGFLPDNLHHKKEVYFRSTNIPRTIESLQQIVHGLYPSEKCGENVPDFLVRNAKDENLLGNTYACKRLEILQLGFAQAAASMYNPVLERLNSRLSKYIDGKPVRVDGKPRASGIMDTIRAAKAHGIKVPSEFEDQAIVDLIERAVVNEWFADRTEEVRRLGMGRLLDDLTRKMRRKIEKRSQDPVKILVHSTHDTALAALCQTLDVFDDQWPAFTASITFELFRKTEATEQNFSDQSISQTVLSRFKSGPPPEHYVRMRYQNKNMILPTCAEEGKHLPGSPEFCTFSAFMQRVKDLIPVDFEAECVPAGKSA